MIVPNAFLLGSAKCATSSLSFWLDQHPDIMVAKNKEPLFFSTNEYAKGLQHNSDENYAKYRGESVVMDNTTMHLMIPYVSKRILESCFDPRFIISVREPIQRAYSHWFMQHNYRPGYARPTFEEALLYNMENFSYNKFEYEYERMQSFDGLYESYIPSYIEQGLYFHHASRYAKLFGWDKIKFVIVDDVIDNPINVYLSILDHLELDEFHPIFKNKKICKRGVTPPLSALVKTKAVKKVLYGTFFEDVLRLSELINRDLFKLWGYDKL